LRPEPIEKLAMDFWRQADAQATIERLERIKQQCAQF